MNSPSLRAKDWVCRRIPHADAKTFIETYHYSRGCSNTGVCFGLYRLPYCNVLRGAAVWIPPTKGAAEYACGADGKAKDRWRGVLSLSRLAIHPSVPKNGASFLIGYCLKRLKKMDVYHLLVTYADEGQGHQGTIYKSTNWVEAGITSPETLWVSDGGRQVSKKAGGKTRTVEQMLALGYRRVGRYSKKRFLFHLRT